MRSDSITYEGNTVAELIEDFHGAVDDYLLLCEEKGIKPKKPYSGTLNVRLTQDIHSRAALAADRAGISINAFIKNAVVKELSYGSPTFHTVQTKKWNYLFIPHQY